MLHFRLEVGRQIKRLHSKFSVRMEQAISRQLIRSVDTPQIIQKLVETILTGKFENIDSFGSLMTLPDGAIQACDEIRLQMGRVT